MAATEVEVSLPTLLDRLASLDPHERREVATIVRGLSDTLAEVPDGKATSHVLGVLARLHFYASGLIAHGCDVVTVQRALGHSSATTTLNTYSHLWPTAEDRTRKASEAMMETSSGTPADSVRTNAT